MSDTPASGFGKFVPGFDFLQGLATQAAGGIAQGLGQNIPQLPKLNHWIAPTFNVEELDKRIEELRAVHFWLDQNAKALGATIQALEVQKMTLSTLKSMNFSMGDVANALKLKVADVAASAPSNPFPAFEPPAAPPPARAARKAPAKKAAASAPAPSAAGGVVDPLQWWGALSQQFQQIATHALKDVAKQGALDTTRQVATGLTDAAVKTAAGLAGQAARSAAGSVGRGVGAATGAGRAAARAMASAARPAPAKKAAPRKARSKGA